MDQQFEELDYSALLDKLVEYSNQYNKLIHENGNSIEKQKIRHIIDNICTQIHLKSLALKDQKNGHK